MPAPFISYKRCKFVFNAIYKQLLYDKTYSSSHSHSVAFRTYLEEVIKELEHLQKILSGLLQRQALEMGLSQHYG